MTHTLSSTPCRSKHHVRPIAATLFAVLLCFVATCFRAQAQQTTATLVGNVTDTTGAAVVGATVKTINTSTNTVRSTITDGGGVYTLPQLPAGTYTLEVEM